MVDMNINHKKMVDANEVYSEPFHFLVNGISFAFEIQPETKILHP